MWSENFKNYIFKIFKLEDTSEVDFKIKNILERLESSFEKPEALPNLFKDSGSLALSILSKKYGLNPHEILEECYELGVKKNADYGNENILRFGVKGLIVRISDKYARVENLLEKKPEVFDESVKDTLKDVINYSTYGVMLCDKVWY